MTSIFSVSTLLPLSLFDTTLFQHNDFSHSFRFFFAFFTNYCILLCKLELTLQHSKLIFTATAAFSNIIQSIHSRILYHSHYKPIRHFQHPFAHIHLSIVSQPRLHSDLERAGTQGSLTSPQPLSCIIRDPPAFVGHFGYEDPFCMLCIAPLKQLMGEYSLGTHLNPTSICTISLPTFGHNLPLFSVRNP